MPVVKHKGDFEKVNLVGEILPDQARMPSAVVRWVTVASADLGNMIVKEMRHWVGVLPMEMY